MTFGALAVLFQYWTSLILVIIAGLTILIQIKREPQVIHFSLGEDGLRIDEKFHPFTEFQSFCILEMLENPSKSAKCIANEIIIEFGSKDHIH